MNTVTFRYGASREITRSLSPQTTVRDVLANPEIRAGLALPENVTAVVDGRTLNNDSRFSDGDVVVFEKQAAAKAA